MKKKLFLLGGIYCFLVLGIAIAGTPYFIDSYTGSRERYCLAPPRTSLWELEITKTDFCQVNIATVLSVGAAWAAIVFATAFFLYALIKGTLALWRSLVRRQD